MAEQKVEVADEATVTVTYWAGRGRVEPTRLMLAAAGIKFNNNFIGGKEDLVAMRESGKLAFNQLPCVEIDGLNLVQTGAMFRYIADKSKMRGSSLKESYVVDMIYESTKDARGPLAGFPFNPNTEETLKKFNSDRYLKAWEAMLGDESVSKDGWFISTPSMADVAVFEVLEGLEIIAGGDTFTEIMKPYPKLSNNYKNARKLGRIEEYIKNERNHIEYGEYVKVIMTDPLLSRIDQLVDYISDIVVERKSKIKTKSVAKIQNKDKQNETAKISSIKGMGSENEKYLDSTWQRDREKQLEILQSNGLKFRPDHDVDPNAERPIGHSTHNLFLKDKKSNQRFLITHHQSHKMDFKAMTKKLKKQHGFKIKELRMDRPSNRQQNVKKYFGFDSGCITALSLLNIEGYHNENGVQWIVDSKLTEMTENLTICAGCFDPMDHTQHHVVDIDCKTLFGLVKSVGLEPVVVEF